MRSMRLAALTVAMTLAFSGLALARDHDDDTKTIITDHYKDKHEDRHHDWDRDRDHHWWGGDHDRNDRNNDRWRESERERAREHERWEREHRNDGYYGGQIYNRYPRGYPGGGYPSGGYPSGGYGYPGTVYGRGGYGNGASGIGFNQGRMEGANQARKDIAQGKPFNPNPRGSNHTDNGYHSYMGDKNQYRASYTEGYRSGYESNFGGGRGRGWGF